MNFHKLVAFSFLAIYFLFLNLLTAQENGGPYTPDENTVLLMHFDGDATNSADVGNDGIKHGSGVSFEDGIHGQCLRLDNSTSDKQSWIEVPFYDELNFTEEFSIELWFKINSWGENSSGIKQLLKKEGPDGAMDYETILWGENNALQANVDCIDEAYPRGVDVSTIDILELNKWYHVAMYFNFSHQHLYILVRDENYKEIYSDRGYAYTKPEIRDGKLMIGFGGGDESYFDGWIDELRISNKYLKFRDDIISEINISELQDSVEPILRDKWQVYQWPFMAYFPKSSETGRIHKGNSCGITAMMRVIYYWEHPRFPMGSIDYDDGEFHWIADYNNTEYRFDEMPDVFGGNPSEEEYSAAATMVAQIGAAAKAKHIGAGIGPVKTIMERYFKYHSRLKIVYREEYTKEEWENIFKNELSHGRPIFIGGAAERFEDGNYGGHYYVCDGYSSDNKFHSDMSMGVGHWYGIDNFDFGQNQDALIFAEPNWGNKDLELIKPKSGDLYQNGSNLEIQWSAENISNLIIEYSSDAGKNWQTIAENVDATEGKYSWIVPETASKEYKVRISDTSDGNIYRRSNSFEVYETQNLEFEYPEKNTTLNSGKMHPLYWQSSGIKAVKIEYSVEPDKWEILCDSALASPYVFSVQMPEGDYDEFVLKATDLTNENLFFYSDTFKIKASETIGDVNNTDQNTLILLHFEENLKNEAQNKFNVNEMVNGQYDENYVNNLGKSYRVDNSKESILGNHLMISNSEEINLGNNWTIETWVNIKSTGDDKTEYYPIIIEKLESFGLYINQDYRGNEAKGFYCHLDFENGTNIEFFQNETLNLNNWYHVSLLSDSASQTVNLFIHDENRELIYEASQSFPEGTTGELKQNQNVVTIGGIEGASNRQFDGWLDELLITKVSKLMDYIETVELPFYDDFEETISQNATFTKWTTQNLEGWHYWHAVTGQGVNYSQCMRFENNDTDQNDWLITRAIDCSGMNQLKINFDVLYNGNGTKPQLFYKSLNKDENSTTGWFELNYSLGAEENKWYSINEITINNPGDIIYLAFHSNQKANQGIYFLLDNFSVKGVTTNSRKLAIPEITFNIYPNPATNESIISFQTKTLGNTNLSVFDIHGRKITTILNKNLPAGSYNYSVGKNIPADGVYFLRLKTQEGISTQKFVFKNE